MVLNRFLFLLMSTVEFINIVGITIFLQADDRVSLLNLNSVFDYSRYDAN